jgi:hypothetical protein
MRTSAGESRQRHALPIATFSAIDVLEPKG